jgi:hypothetical protein
MQPDTAKGPPKNTKKNTEVGTVGRTIDGRKSVRGDVAFHLKVPGGSEALRSCEEAGLRQHAVQSPSREGLAGGAEEEEVCTRLIGLPSLPFRYLQGQAQEQQAQGPGREFKRRILQCLHRCQETSRSEASPSPAPKMNLRSSCARRGGRCSPTYGVLAPRPDGARPSCPAPPAAPRGTGRLTWAPLLRRAFSLEVLGVRTAAARAGSSIFSTITSTCSSRS